MKKDLSDKSMQYLLRADHPTVARQADIVLIADARMHKSLIDITPPTGSIVLDHDKATGHANVIHDRGTPEQPTAKLWQDSGEKILQVFTEVALHHDECGALLLPPGNYRIQLYPNPARYARICEANGWGLNDWTTD
jgi:hypothetical protein